MSFESEKRTFDRDGFVIVRQFLTEAVTLSSIGGLIGVALLGVGLAAFGL